MSRTTCPTSSAVSRLSSSRAANSAAKPGLPVLSRRGMGGAAGAGQPVDPARDLVGPGLQRRAIDTQARADLGDALDLDEAVGLQGGAGRDEVDDALAQAERRGELERAVEFDAFRLHAARREIAAGDIGIFGRDPHMAP